VERHKPFRKGLNNPAGFVLPRKDYVADNWESCAWEFRRGNCFLVPGNSQLDCVYH
jgi:uncharacterized protein (DUF2126 family)